jgi:hypothetical protein
MLADVEENVAKPLRLERSAGETVDTKSFVDTLGDERVVLVRGLFGWNFPFVCGLGGSGFKRLFQLVEERVGCRH